MAKTVTTQPTANPDEFIVTVDNDGAIHSFVTTPKSNEAKLKVYYQSIATAQDMTETVSHINAQINGMFNGKSITNRKFNLRKRYGNMTEYFPVGTDVVLYTKDLDESDPDPENWTKYPPLVTTVIESTFEDDSVNHGNVVGSTRVKIEGEQGDINYNKIEIQL